MKTLISLAVLTASLWGCGKNDNENSTQKPGIVEFTVDQNKLISSNFAGFGAQYNQNLYAAISEADGINPGNIGQLEAKVTAMKSQYVRIFFDSKGWASDPKYSSATADYMESFIKTVKLAQNAGASIINITYWHTATSAKMPAFADVLKDLIVNRGLTAVKEVTIQNEVNSTTITKAEYKTFYESLDQALKNLGIRDQIRFVGGDLVATNQLDWFTYMGANMNELLQGYSSHMYWDDGELAKPTERLTDVSTIVNALGTAKKPVYLTEYGVRGGVKTGAPEPGFLSGTTNPISQTTTAALQNALFHLNGLNLGYSGFIRWDCYKAKYDNGSQYFSSIGSGTDGYPLHPLYYMTTLFTYTSKPGWNVVETRQGNNQNKVVAMMKAQKGQDMTIYALNKTNSSSRFVIAGLPAKMVLHVLAWNNEQKGKLTKVADATTNEEGVLNISLQALSAAAITTLDVDISKIP